MRDEVIRLVRDSVIVQGLITLLVVFTSMQMYLRYGSVPTDLLNLLNLIVGFWFGSKVTASVMRR